MRLYSGLSTDFIRDIPTAFFRQYRHNPAPSEVNSWRNSLRAVSLVIDDAGLRDHGILLEYQLPMSSSRLDCMITGQDEGRRDNAVILELKQWETCGDAGADNLVTTYVGGRQRDLLHPSAQVHQYQRYLQDSHTAFYESPAPIELVSRPRPLRRPLSLDPRRLAGLHGRRRRAAADVPAGAPARGARRAGPAAGGAEQLPAQQEAARARRSGREETVD